MIESYSKGCSTKPVYIWGGALYGECTYMALRDLWGVSVAGIIDNRLSSLPWAGEEAVLRSSELENMCDVDIIICAAASFGTILREIAHLSKNGIKPYDARIVLRDFSKACSEGIMELNSTFIYGDIDFDEMIEKYDFCAGVKNGYDKKVFLPYCVCCITTKCSLRCKDCAAFVNDYKPQEDYSILDISDHLRMLLDAVDGILELELMGGEPFLHREFNNILYWCLTQKKIRAIKIVSNGTIMPSLETWKLLSNRKVKLVLDDYGKLSKRIGDIRERALKDKVLMEVQQLQTWYNVTPVDKRFAIKCSEKELQSVYRKCVFSNCLGITNGRFYHCNVAGHMYNAGLLEENNADYIDFRRQWQPEVLRELIKGFLGIPYLQACRRCGYRRGIEVPVAAQV